MSTATANELRRRIQTGKDDCALNKECSELQAWVTARLDVLSKLRSEDEKWSREIQDGEAAFDEELARELYAFYEDWYADWKQVDEKIANLADRGRTIFGTAEHRRAGKDVRDILRSMSVDDIVEAMTA